LHFFKKIDLRQILFLHKKVWLLSARKANCMEIDENTPMIKDDSNPLIYL